MLPSRKSLYFGKLSIDVQTKKKDRMGENSISINI